MTHSNPSISAATIAQLFNLLASTIAGSQLHGAMRKSRQPRCTAAQSLLLVAMTPKPLDQSRNFGRAIFTRYRRSRRTGRTRARDGTKLSKACPKLKPPKQATACPRCLIFDLELLDIRRLGFGGFDPLLHFRERHDHVGIGL